MVVMIVMIAMGMPYGSGRGSDLVLYSPEEYGLFLRGGSGHAGTKQECALAIVAELIRVKNFACSG